MTQGNNWCVNHLCKFHSKYGLVHKSVFRPWLDLSINLFTSVFMMIGGNSVLTQFIFGTSAVNLCKKWNCYKTEGFGILNCVETETKCKCSRLKNSIGDRVEHFWINLRKANMEPTDWENLIWLPNGHTAKFAF